MSARTYFRIYVYACPQDQEAAAARLLREKHGLGYHDDEAAASLGTHRLSLGSALIDYEISMDFGQILAPELIAAAPGANWQMWNDADCGQLGTFYAYTPQLGLFGPVDCDSGGDVALSASSLTEMLSGLRGANGRAYREALEAALGKPWRVDYDLHLARQRDGLA